MSKAGINRRQFIKQTAFSLAIPTIISSSALGKGNATAPSERINIGVIGVGGTSSRYFPATGELI